MIDLLVAIGCLSLGFFGLGFCLAWWLFREKPISQKAPYPAYDEDELLGGWCQADGSVWCGLCDWKGQANSTEYMEAIIIDHMKEHGLIPLSKIDMETGEETEFPRTCEGEDNVS